MKFGELSSYLEKLEKTSSRLEITKILSDLFKKASSSEIDKITYLILGQLAPSYQGIVFNIAERMMLQVIAKAYAVKPEEVKRLYKEKGDLGEVAYSLSQSLSLRKTSESEVIRIYEQMLAIAKDEGEGSQDRKIEKMAAILSRVDPLSARFLARIPVGRLRLGFSDKTIIDALSWMETGDKSLSPKLSKAYEVVPDIGLLAKRVKEEGFERAVKNIKPVTGIPVLPMLAQRLKSPVEMIVKMGEVAVEPKFDGLRVLIHYKKNFLKAFTRNLNDISEMFPELKEIGKYLNVKEAILDTEAIGMDPEMMKIADFQVTMQRRRKYEIEEKAREIPLRFQVFDVILKDGESLMETSYRQRRKVLEGMIKKNNFLVIDEIVFTNDPEVINKEYKKRIKEGLEGVIVKKADAPYVPGRTGWRWVKMKEEEEAVGKLSDTVDCIVMGYYAGRGKRAGFGMGGFLVGILDGEVIKTVTKIGTGLTDEQFREMHRKLKNLRTEERQREYEVHKDLYPDFWVIPEVVVEIAADEITVSPKHTAGLALRFPRLVRFRGDKTPAQATTLKELQDLFGMQKT